MDTKISDDAIAQFLKNSIKIETQKVFNEVLAEEMAKINERVEKKRKLFYLDFYYADNPSIRIQ
jgi:hypothetical protein